MIGVRVNKVLPLRAAPGHVINQTLFSITAGNSGQCPGGQIDGNQFVQDHEFHLPISAAT